MKIVGKATDQIPHGMMTIGVIVENQNTLLPRAKQGPQP